MSLSPFPKRRRQDLASVAIIAAVLTAATSCLLPTGDCTTEFRYGLSVFVKDSITGAPAASGATLVTVDQNGHVDSISFSPGRPDLDSMALPGAGEHPGTFVVTVRKPGYRDWVRSGVRVTADRCHVRQTTITALLQR